MPQSLCHYFADNCAFSWSALSTTVYAPACRLQANPITLYETARVSVLHASFMDYLLRLANERYNLLSQWPDFTTMMGKDYYYRLVTVTCDMEP